MSFTVKMANYNDLNEASRVEREAMGSYVYLFGAWHYFESLGEGMVCVYDGDKLVGIGRFSVLPDGSGWLETLRVTPEYQGRGVGKLIYEKWLEMAKKYNCPSMAMFTGVTNAVSSGLAERYGLKTAAYHKGYNLTDFEGGSPHGFAHTSYQRAVELCMPKKDEYHDYICFNRTFHHINEANIKAFACEGKVFEDKESGSFIVCGARFAHGTALHIAMMDGDLDKCIDFAVNYAKAQGIKKISCTFAVENEKLENALKQRGFAEDEKLIITKEIKF